MFFLFPYFVISTVVVGVDMILAFRCYRKKNRSGVWLGHGCVGAAIVQLSYMASILPVSYFQASMAASIYFVTIDFMLVSMIYFVHEYTGSGWIGKGKIFRFLMLAYGAFDVVVLLSNPFHEMAISYVKRGTELASYGYVMKPLYIGHLIYSYLLVICILLYLIRKLLQVPSVYRNQYIFSIVGILFVVALNAVFLYWPNVTFFDALDYSIWGYSIAAFSVYWNCFEYASHGMLDHLRKWIVDNISQGIVLFDFENRLVLSNQKAREFLPSVSFEDGTPIQDFLEIAKIDIQPENRDQNLSVQYFLKNADKSRSVRCDYRPILSEKGKCLGKMLVFSNIRLEKDILTGYVNADNIKQSLMLQNRTGEWSVGVCDINGLQNINHDHGRSGGDHAIQVVANVMREVLPQDTLFVRGQEAYLFAVSGLNENQLLSYFPVIQEKVSATAGWIGDLKIQFAVSTSKGGEDGVLDAMDAAVRSMRVCKLLDSDSSHSELLSSLVRILEECDVDTKEHVRRTQKLGDALSKKLGLNYMEQNDLSLLCIMHDIGKIGIPLEILNKPGKLTEEEREVLKTHTEKGYQIASSSHEMAQIADKILYHHERWDGKGYPKGLAGEAIPLLSRIIAVVDAYDAMTHDRSYRRALSKEFAITELKKNSGTQFDAKVVEAFLEILEETEDTGERTETVYQMPDASSEEKQAESSGQVKLLLYSKYILNDENRIISTDDEFEHIVGYSKADIENRPIYQIDLILPEDRADYQKKLEAQLQVGTLAYFRHRILCKDGSVVTVLCYGNDYYNSAKRCQETEVIITRVDGIMDTNEKESV